jgi:DNA polymerase-3 subunit delta
MAGKAEGLAGFLVEIRSGRLAAAYLLHGEDAWQKEAAALALRSAVVPAGGEGAFDLVLLEGSSCSLSEVTDAARTLPLFSSRRLVWVKEAEAIRDTAIGPLEEYLADPSSSTCLLFVAGSGKPDFRKALFKLLQQRAVVREFHPLKGAQLQRWIRERARDLGAEIEPDATSLLEFHAGPETMRLDQELRKAVDFAAPRHRIAVTDVEATLGISAAASVFEWVDTTAAGRAPESVSLLRGILAEGEEPVRLLFLLTRHLRMLILGKALSRQGVRGRDLAAAVGFPPFPGLIDKFQGQIARFPEAAAAGTYRKLLVADRSMKSGSRPGAVLERLVLDLRDLGPASRPRVRT